ncbi:uncharacterized protein LOC143290286 isoform X2 [Babylonia areolata]
MAGERDVRSTLPHWNPSSPGQGVDAHTTAVQTRVTEGGQGLQLEKPGLRMAVMKVIFSLHSACLEGLIDSVKALVNDGADVNGRITVQGTHRDCSHREWDSPLYQAVLHGHGHIVQFLARNGAIYIKRCPVPKPRYQDRVSEGVHRQDCVSEDVQLATCEGHLLQLAAIYCSSAVGFLMDFYQGDISPLDVYDALLAAVRAGNEESTRAIVARYQLETDPENPAKVKVPSNLYLLIRFAIRECRQSNETLPLLLLERFGKPLADDSSSRTACERINSLLQAAIIQSLVLTVEKLTQLFEVSVDKDQIHVLKDACHVTISALSRGSLPILKRLTASRLVDLKQHPEALFHTIGCGAYGVSTYETLSWLVTEWGFDPTACVVDGVAPIHFAVKTGDVVSLEALLKLGVDMNSVNSRDLLTPVDMYLNVCLLQLGRRPEPELLALLVRHGADLTRRNRSGYTALSVLFWLAQRGAEASLRNTALSPRFSLAMVSTNHCHTYRIVFVPTQSQESLASSRAGTEPSVLSADSSESEDQSDRTVLGEQPLPWILSRDQPMRPFMEKVVNKFGLALLSMGADTLTGPEYWHIVVKNLHRAKIPWQHVPSLQTCCWRTVRGSVGGRHFQHKVDQLPLPLKLKQYLKEL